MTLGAPESVEFGCHPLRGYPYPAPVPHGRHLFGTCPPADGLHVFAEASRGLTERQCGGGLIGLRHLVPPGICVLHRGPIARLLRGDDDGPVKTGPDLAELWCAILGLNQINQFASCGGLTSANNISACTDTAQCSGT